MNTAVAGRAPRFIIYGAGAIGGTIGSRLFQHGSEVVLVARGAHREAIAANGLRLVAPEESRVQRIPVVGEAAEVDWRSDDVVVLATKSQDTVAALDLLAAAAPAAIAVACAQNGVANERAALRRFAGVYAICVQLPTTHLEPGVVVAHSAPLTGCLDIGRYPAGVDERAEAIAAALARGRLRLERASGHHALEVREAAAQRAQLDPRAGRPAAGRPRARAPRRRASRGPSWTPPGSSTYPTRSTTPTTARPSRSGRSRATRARSARPGRASRAAAA